jgi:hypothetical protein
MKKARLSNEKPQKKARKKARSNNENKPQWSDPNLAPDQFLYQRLGPWPQPCPSYPMEQAPEVLGVPPVEAFLWNGTIGARYLNAQTFYPPVAAANAVKDGALPIPSDAEFVRMMTASVYARFMRETKSGWVADFRAMELIAKDTLPGTFCAPTICHFSRNSDKQFQCDSIEFFPTSFPPFKVKPGEVSWNLAKVYALQGAAYQSLFVVHPALHFPMDSVNAITKTAVPHIHPLYQLLYPHTSYTLALDNAVLEGANTVVNNNAPGTWFDPLTANGFEVKRLFGAGYKGLEKYKEAYPEYKYLTPWMDAKLPYGACLQAYFKPFLDFCTTVAEFILAQSPNDPYVARWADYNSVQVKGFPDAKKIFETGVLAQAMAIYMWDVTVSHGADHFSFANDIAAAYKFLRVRRHAPPINSSDGPMVQLVGDVCDPDDLCRTEMAQEMFFSAWTMWPNLIDTGYPFTSPALLQAQGQFKKDLAIIEQKVAKLMPNFMPLGSNIDKGSEQYRWTIPASIQY